MLREAFGKKGRGLGFWLVLALSLPCLSVPVPNYTRPVLDEAQLLSSEEVTRLETKLEEMHQTGRISLAVYIAPSLFETSIEELAEQVFRKWALGRKGQDQGVLLLIAPRERKMRLEVGYGLEGELTDAFCKGVLDDELRPFFKESRYADGILRALHTISNKLNLSLSGPVPTRPSVWEKIIRNENTQRVAWIMLVPAFLVCFLGFIDAAREKKAKAIMRGVIAYLFLSLFIGLFFFVGLEEKAYLFIAIPGIFYLLLFIAPIPLILFKLLFPTRYQAWDKALELSAKAREASERSLGPSHRGKGGKSRSWWGSTSGSPRSSSSSSFSGGGSSGGGGASSSW